MTLDDDLDRIVAARDRDDMGPTIAALLPLLERHPSNPRMVYEVGGAYDTAGDELTAVGLYERALAAGLEGDIRRRCLLQYGSTLRNLGRIEESLAVFGRARQEFPDSVALAVFEALTLHAAGRPHAAFARALEIIADHVDGEDLDRYKPAIRGNADHVRGLDPVTIRPEQPADHVAVAGVVGEAFADEPEVAGMVAAIRASGGYLPGLALVAVDGDRVEGFVMVSRAELEDDDGRRHPALTLTPLAVEPEHQGRGIGSALVRAVLSTARGRDDLPRVVLLEGDPAFYRRLGFVDARPHGIRFRLPAWAPPEAGQVVLFPGHDPAVRGRVVYPPAIEAVSGPDGPDGP